MGRTKLPLTGKKTGSGYKASEIQDATEREEFLNKFDGDITIPSFLNEEEKETYLFLVNELLEINLYTNLDSIIVGQYVQLYHQYMKALETLRVEGQFVSYTNKGGETNVVESASSKLVRQLLVSMQNISKKLPFSPLDRLQFRDLFKTEEKSLSEILMSDEDED